MPPDQEALEQLPAILEGLAEVMSKLDSIRLWAALLVEEGDKADGPSDT